LAANEAFSELNRLSFEARESVISCFSFSNFKRFSSIIKNLSLVMRYFFSNSLFVSRNLLIVFDFNMLVTIKEIHIIDNHQRFVLHSVDWCVSTVRFIPISTFGSNDFRLFDFELN
jgi:hypothetical protein